MSDDKNNEDDGAEDGQQEMLGKKGESRRDLIRNSGVMALAGMGALAASSVDAKSSKKSKKHRHKRQIFPKYFPQDDFEPDLDIAGKFAVVTGASRGIGRATAEALVVKGVTVIGTSRDVSSIPDDDLPTTFALLDLDVSSKTSIDSFVEALIAHGDYPGAIDILINNGARFVIGTPVPPPFAPAPVDFFMNALDEAMDTLYHGHVRLTNLLMPRMPTAGYSRLLYTVSIVAYGVGGTDEGEALGQSFFQAYMAGKRALLAYANSLRGFLRSAGSNIRVSTVNPYAINTDLAIGTRPIFTEPVDSDGDTLNPFLQQVLDGTRLSLQNGLPAELVAEAYMQLLCSDDPLPNVVAASEDEMLALQGSNALFNEVALAENDEGAASFGCEPIRKKSDKSNKSKKSHK